MAAGGFDSEERAVIKTVIFKEKYLRTYINVMSRENKSTLKEEIR